MNYKVILFDADGTLFNYDKAEAYALEKAFEHFNLKYNEKDELRNYRLINKQIWMEYENGQIDSDNLRIQRFKRLFEDYEEKINFNDFSKIYLSLLGSGIFLIDGAEEVCSYLSGKYKIVILTNGIKEVQLLRIYNSPLSKYIHHIITSEETGYKKPDVGIFDYTFNRIAHLDKCTALIIGDSLSSDIQGGINYEIDTCWYNPIGEENKSDLKPNYEIKDLRQLIELL